MRSILLFLLCSPLRLTFLLLRKNKSSISEGATLHRAIVEVDKSIGDVKLNIDRFNLKITKQVINGLPWFSFSAAMAKW